MEQCAGSVFSRCLVRRCRFFAKINRGLCHCRRWLDCRGGFAEWFVIVVFLVAAFDVLGLNQVTAFLQQVVLLYLPQVIVAALILLAAAVIAEAMQKVIVGSAKAVGVKFAHLAGTITRWAIWVFAILAALFQLGIAAAFIQTLFTGMVVALALALGLSFGLGGQEAAARYIEKIRQEIAEKK